VALRGRLTLMSALIVGVTLVLAAVIAYSVVRGQILGQVDAALRAQAGLYQRRAARLSGTIPEPGQVPIPPPQLGGPGGYVQAVGGDGTVVPLFDPVAAGVSIPVTEVVRAIARAGDGERLADAQTGATHLRVLTVGLPGIGAVQVARPLDAGDKTLNRLRAVLVLLCVAGTAIAAAMSRLFSRAVIAPITELTETAEHIETTGDLDRRIETTGGDEVGRMGERFNAMLDRVRGSQHALAESIETQRRLIGDASHELRTPVTSLRTNAEVLRDVPGLEESERHALAADLADQAQELGELVADLIELARGNEPGFAVEDVRLDELVAEAVVRARRHSPDVRFEATLAPVSVEGAPDRIGRAVNNLLDNAARHSPPGGRVDVRVASGEVSVRDRGAGVNAAEAEHIFDRFYRGANARDRPGSGLGLAIVRQVAEAHGGSVTVETPEGGGALFRLRLPGVGASPS
jgi:two-component system sensor histidine kinase MprB